MTNVHVNVEIDVGDGWQSLFSCNTTQALLPIVYGHAADKERQYAQSEATASGGPGNPYTPTRITVTNEWQNDDETYTLEDDLQPALDAAW